MTEPLLAKVRRIGTSYGIILPKDYLEKSGIREGDIIMIKEIEPVHKAEDMKGMFPGLTFQREHGTDRF